MMKKTMVIGLVVLALAVISAEAGREDWKIGVQCWTFNNKTLMETADYCCDNGVFALEIYPGQRIGGDLSGTTTHNMSAEDAKTLKAALEKRGVSLLSYGVVRAGSEEEWRSVFEFAKRMGIKTVITEPNKGQMAMLDKLTDEYGVKIGIHNHGSPTPDEVDALLKGCSDRLGIAPDNGHWSRRGIDNLTSLKRFEGRTHSIHFKDINDKKQDVPYGEGMTPVAEILAYLDKSDYKGPVIIEYESGNQEEDVAKCIRYLKAFIAAGKAPSAEEVAQSPEVFVDMKNINTVLERYKRSAEVGWKGVGLAAASKALKGEITGSALGATRGEGPDKVFDGEPGTKYCLLEPTMWVQIKLAEGKKRVESYSITSGNDAPGRDPKDWVLKGSNDGNNWTELDRRTGEDFDGRFDRRSFKVSAPGEYTWYRLEVTKNHGMDSSQIAELELL